MVSGLIKQTCEPSAARHWFNLRETVNWTATIALFIPLFFVLMLLLGSLVAFIISFAAVFCLFFFVLEKRVIRISCEKCGKFIDTNTPWICGSKGCRNDHVDDFPFIYRCEHCGYYPKAYECHHCGELIFFSEDQQRTGYARCANAPVAIKRPKQDEHGLEATEIENKIKVKGLQVKEAELDLQLKGYKERLEPAKSIEEKYRALLKNEDDALRLEASINEEFKNDKDERERRLLIVKAITRGSL